MFPLLPSHGAEQHASAYAQCLEFDSTHQAIVMPGCRELTTRFLTTALLRPQGGTHTPSYANAMTRRSMSHQEARTDLPEG